MNRRTFIKAIGTIALSPMVPDLSGPIDAVERIRNKGTIYWVNKSSGEIVGDLKQLREDICRVTKVPHRLLFK